MKTFKSCVFASAISLTLLSGAALAHGGYGSGGMMNPEMGTMQHGAGMMGHGMGMMQSGSGMMGHGMGMMGMSVEDLGPEQLDLIGEHIQLMHEQKEKIANAEDPEARRALVKEPLKSMQGFMHARRAMMMENMKKKQMHGSWRQQIEQRMHRMEEMMKQ